MAEWEDAVLASSHGHTKITTKRWNSQPGETSEDLLNRNPITKDTKKKPCRGGRDTKWAGSVPMNAEG